MNMDFERCWPYLEPAIGTPATHTKADVWNAIEARRAVFWPMERSAVVSNILTAPTGLRSGNAWLAGGNLGEILDLLPSLETYAKSERCNRAIARVRPGFMKALKPYGYRVLGVQMVKEL